MPDKGSEGKGRREAGGREGVPIVRASPVGKLVDVSSCHLVGFPMMHREWQAILDALLFTETTAGLVSDAHVQARGHVERVLEGWSK